MLQQSGLAQSLDRLQEQTGGQVADGTVGLFVRESVYNDKMSAEKDEPVYVLHDYCIVRVPGNARENMKALVRKVFPDGREVVVSDWYTNKYGKAWDAFLRGEDLRPPGTRLEECDAIPKQRLLGLKQAQVQTVEELINLPDASLRRVGHDARALQRAAENWLNEQNKTANLAERVKELEELLKERQDNGNDQDDMPKRRRRGRPRKSEQLDRQHGADGPEIAASG